MVEELRVNGLDLRIAHLLSTGMRYSSQRQQDAYEFARLSRLPPDSIQSSADIEAVAAILKGHRDADLMESFMQRLPWSTRDRIWLEIRRRNTGFPKVDVSTLAQLCSD